MVFILRGLFLKFLQSLQNNLCKHFKHVKPLKLCKSVNLEFQIDTEQKRSCRRICPVINACGAVGRAAV
jgi:hypothetical protein